MDHIFNLSDFFDFVTAKESKGFKLEDMMSLDEKKIFHFTTNGDLSDLSFLNADRGEFVISGFSMIRHERSLYWYLIGGEVLGKDAWQLKCSEQPEIELKHIDPVKRAFLKESLEKNKTIGAPIGLEGTNFTQKNIIAGEIDIITQKHLSRCYMNEYENTISTLCDDPETLYRLNEVNRESLLQSMIKELNNSSIIWNLAEGLLQLPQYFSYKVPLTNKNESKSDFMRPYRTFIKGGAGIDSKYITIPAIDINSTKKPAIRELFLPHYMTETNGHWRKLKEGQIGHDPDGKKTSGRTWVKQPINWKAVETEAQAIYVKDCLSTARIRINEYETALKKASKKVITNNEKDENLGEVYVMRCPAMNEQVFKVGYTSGKSIDRAKELSRATGIPLTFIVVRSWKHTKPAALEKEIHIMLAPYCINGRREFFYASFEKINKIIEGVLQRIEN